MSMFNCKPHHHHRHNNNCHHAEEIHHDPFAPAAGRFDNRINIMIPPPPFPIPGALFETHELAAANPLAAASTRMDWHETPDAHVLRARLPGFRKDEVRLEVEEEGHAHALRLTCEKKAEVEEKADGWYRVARSSGRVLQRLTLPPDSDPHRMAAAMENGVLTVTIPKKQLQAYNY